MSTVGKFWVSNCWKNWSYRKKNCRMSGLFVYGMQLNAGTLVYAPNGGGGELYSSFSALFFKTDQIECLDNKLWI